MRTRRPRIGSGAAEAAGAAEGAPAAEEADQSSGRGLMGRFKDAVAAVRGPDKPTEVQSVVDRPDFHNPQALTRVRIATEIRWTAKTARASRCSTVRRDGSRRARAVSATAG